VRWVGDTCLVSILNDDGDEAMAQRILDAIALEPRPGQAGAPTPR
jgi:hypothetical protein